ncbi:ATP-binding protein [Hyphobacterium sp.]|uniref:ATP-binding protein n=1 Tax=Hyphobacterium sp. TaxID=2004662 RepID=UPI0037479D18
MAGHLEGVSGFEQPGDLIAIEAGSNTLVARVETLSFAEPRELHNRGKQSGTSHPLRQLRAQVIGLLSRIDEKLRFSPQTTRLPALGAQVYPLSGSELKAALNASDDDAATVYVGNEARNPSLRVRANLDDLLTRHMVVLGATGQGKTHFVADVLQQIAEVGKKARVVIFDVNGEYYKAFRHLGDQARYTALGNTNGRCAPEGSRPFKIPYFALGRQGIFRLLLPSDKTQAPALRFALEHLAYIEGDANGARPFGAAQNVLFDDGRSGDAGPAHTAIERVKQKIQPANRWPHMRGLGCLCAESFAIKQANNRSYARDGFLYGNIQPLITRINTLILDSQFQAVVDVSGGTYANDVGRDLGAESKALIDDLFGAPSFQENDWRVHVIDLSQLAQDLMPFILGALLEQFSEQLFRRGANATHPTLLVLEEAHHYLRQPPGDSETGSNTLAYERLAKEGRKFGLSLLVSTQRPAELSPTVLPCPCLVAHVSS